MTQTSFCAYMHMHPRMQGNDFVMVGPISQNVHIMTYDGSRIDGTLSEILTSYQLKTISMTSNSIGGTIPAWITNIIGLNEINLNDNNLRVRLRQCRCRIVTMSGSFAGSRPRCNRF
eukprot:365219-Chlamydomonas_euryale.AAC.42